MRREWFDAGQKCIPQTQLGEHGCKRRGAGRFEEFPRFFADGIGVWHGLVLGFAVWLGSRSQAPAWERIFSKLRFAFARGIKHQINHHKLLYAKQSFGKLGSQTGVWEPVVLFLFLNRVPLGCRVIIAPAALS